MAATQGMSFRVSMGALALMLAATSSASAQTLTLVAEPAPDVVEQARALFDSGVALSQEERWSEALEAFRRSRALVERPSTIFNIATALQRLGRPTDAIVAVDAFLAIAEPVRDGAQVDQARTLRVVLDRTLAHVTLRIRPSTAELSVDARPVPSGDLESDVRELVLDPGDHVLALAAPGFTARRIDVALAPGAISTEEIALDRIPVTPAALTIHASRADAHIRVDDQDVGVGDAEVQVPTGSHVVRVEALEHRPFQQIVVLAPAERLEVEASLQRTSGGSILDEPALWIVAACVAAVGVGVGIGVGVATSSSASTTYGGTSGVSIGALTIPW